MLRFDSALAQFENTADELQGVLTELAANGATKEVEDLSGLAQLQLSAASNHLEHLLEKARTALDSAPA